MCVCVYRGVHCQNLEKAAHERKKGFLLGKGEHKSENSDRSGRRDILIQKVRLKTRIPRSGQYRRLNTNVHVAGDSFLESLSIHQVDPGNPTQVLGLQGSDFAYLISESP